MFLQSINSSTGTSRGFSEYNVDHAGGVVTEFLFEGEPKALEPFFDYALRRDGNPRLSEAWRLSK